MREAVAAARRDRSAGVVWTATDVLERDAKNTLPATKFWMLPLPEDARASLRVEKAMKATLDSMTAADGDLDARYDAFRSELFHFEFLMRDLLGA